MPTFVFKKLVRDKLKEEYERTNQKATYRSLSPEEHFEALKNKFIEEVRELSINSSKEDMASELADLQQVLDDLAALKDISSDVVRVIQQTKHDKKGGFSGATFVETLELAEDDEWVSYYRKYPNIFEEIA